MSKIRGANTRPELIVRKTLHILGYRFRLHGRDLPGNPDIVLPRHRAIIFVHGCFWHQHARCAKSKLPATNVRFWKNKILGNVQRDRRVIAKLRRSGWRVLIIWECKTKNDAFIEKLLKFLENERRKTSVATKTLIENR